MASRPSSEQPALPTVRKLPPGTPYQPIRWEPADAAAMVALRAGTANPEQQRRALDWIVLKASGIHEFHYLPSDRDTAFALGRAFVGQQIDALLQKSALHRRIENEKPVPTDGA